MELVDYLRMVRRRWVWVVGSVVVVTMLAGLYSMITPKSYKASAELYVGSVVYGNSTSQNAAAQSASTYVFDRIDTYASLADSPVITKKVITELGLATSPQDLAKQISAAVVPNTVLITVSATDASPDLAAKIANSVATNLKLEIPAIDNPVSGAAAPFDIQLTKAASTPVVPDSPSRSLLLTLGVLVGLALGLMIASLRDQASRTRGEVPAEALATSHELIEPETPNPVAVTTKPTKPDAEKPDAAKPAGSKPDTSKPDTAKGSPSREDDSVPSVDGPTSSLEKALASARRAPSVEVEASTSGGSRPAGR